ncbi:MAG: hypothetical protein K8T91_17125 [Planctomycetes bacterium]|nr:hypothetical protein [Planctomycetota bacterium]
MAIRYEITCRCGRKTPVEARQAGEQITCSCGSLIDVPTLRGLASLPQIQQREPSRSGWTRTQGICFVVGIVVMAIGLGAGWRFWSLSNRPAEVLKFDQVAHDLSGRVDRLTPSESLTYWRMYRDQPSGMLTGEQRVQAGDPGNKHYRMMMWGAGAVAFVGFAILICGLIAGRRNTA